MRQISLILALLILLTAGAFAEEYAMLSVPEAESALPVPVEIPEAEPFLEEDWSAIEDMLIPSARLLEEAVRPDASVSVPQNTTGSCVINIDGEYTVTVPEYFHETGSGLSYLSDDGDVLLRVYFRERISLEQYMAQSIYPYACWRDSVNGVQVVRSTNSRYGSVERITFNTSSHTVTLDVSYVGGLSGYMLLHTTTADYSSFLNSITPAHGSAPEMLAALESWRMSPDGRSCYIDKPTIVSGSGDYLIAYNIYNAQGEPVNYFYSDEARVAVTLPENGKYNIYVVVSDWVTGEKHTLMTGWFDVTGYRIDVTAPQWSMSADNRTCFITRPAISGTFESIAYNIYDAQGNAVNYFYSSAPSVAATMPADGEYNIYIVVRSDRETKTVMTGWMWISGYQHQWGAALNNDGCIIRTPVTEKYLRLSDGSSTRVLNADNDSAVIDGIRIWSAKTADFIGELTIMTSDDAFPDTSDPEQWTWLAKVRINNR